jgi:hypothetical protein
MRRIKRSFLDDLIKPRSVHFWGEDYEVTPVLIDHVHGDGLQLIYVEPLNTRPNYYLARIDSSVIESEDDVMDLIDEELLDEIEAQFGVHVSELEDDDDDIIPDENEWIEGEEGETRYLYRGWPAPSIDSGWSYGEVNVPSDMIEDVA